MKRDERDAYMKCLIKRGLPFILALTTGLWLANYISFFKPPIEKSIHEAPRKRTTSFRIKHVPDVVIPDAALRSLEFAGSRDWFTASIRLEAVLRADGKVTEIKPVRMLPYGVNDSSIKAESQSHVSAFIFNHEFVPELPYGLTQSAIEAVRRIEFTPAMIDGRPISVRVTINSDFGYTSAPAGDVIPDGYSHSNTMILEDGIVKWRTRYSYEKRNDEYSDVNEK